jgi:hypothetical protein
MMRYGGMIEPITGRAAKRKYYRGHDFRRAVSIDELRALAERHVPRLAFEYLDGGAEDEVTPRRNREVLERIKSSRSPKGMIAMPNGRPNFYLITRDLHRYAGLFLSPFVLLFAVSVILLIHPDIPLGESSPLETEDLHVDVPPGFDKIEGMERVEQAKQMIRQVGVSGEIGFVNYSRSTRTITIPVSKPGSESIVTITSGSGTTSVIHRKTGFWTSLIFFHKMPGPHLANIRGNWPVVRAWAWLADGTAWLLLFLSVSGIYLWTILRAERRVGLVLIVAGLISFLGALYAVSG